MRLTPILSSNVRRVLGSQNFAAMLSGKRAQLMLDIRDNMNQDARELRHRRSSTCASAMPTCRRPTATRSISACRRNASARPPNTAPKATKPRSASAPAPSAKCTVLTAEATRESEILRGEGDAEKTRILGEAYGQDPDFFAFYRSMQAYQDALPGDNTTVVLSPDSEFFKYFGQAAGAASGNSLRRST